VEREEYLERLILGLEMAIPENQAKLKYYKPEELEHVYTKKFLAAMEENLARARQELEELQAKKGG